MSSDAISFCGFPRDSVDLFRRCLLPTPREFISYSEHSPQSKFRAGTFFTLRYFSSLFNFNLRLTNVQIIFSIHVAVDGFHARGRLCHSIAHFDLKFVRWMHMKFWWKTKLHRRSAAAYIAVHVLHASALGWGWKKKRMIGRKCAARLRAPTEGGNGLFTFSPLVVLAWNFPKQRLRERGKPSACDSLINREDEKLFGFPARSTFINRRMNVLLRMRNFYVFTTKGRWILLEWKTLNGSVELRCFFRVSCRLRFKEPSKWERTRWLMRWRKTPRRSRPTLTLNVLGQVRDEKLSISSCLCRRWAH